MAEERGFKELVRWAMTPPQAYLVYLVALILVWGISFYAGTLSPKKAPPTPSSQVTPPHS